MKIPLKRIAFLFLFGSALFLSATTDESNNETYRSILLFQEDKNNNKILEINAEIAKTDKIRAKGLMNRKKLAKNVGMLFIFDKEKEVTMWMKNTLIPLDMIFFDKNKKAIYIKHKAEPMNLKHIKSPKPTKYVLEINGGLIEEKFDLNKETFFTFIE